MKRDPMGLNAAEIMLRSESAAALKAAGHALERKIAELEKLSRRIDETALAERRALLEKFRLQRAAALDARWKLVVQREAMGLTLHDDLDALYPIPPAREA